MVEGVNRVDTFLRQLSDNFGLFYPDVSNPLNGAASAGFPVGGPSSIGGGFHEPTYSMNPPNIKVGPMGHIPPPVNVGGHVMYGA